VVGVALGFAGGYGVGVHDRPATTLPTPPIGASAGREFTEDGVEPGTPSRSAARNRVSSSVSGVAPKAALAAAAIASEGTRVQAENAGTLLVRTTPPGAEVFVDGRGYGRAPLAVRDLPRGAHRLRVERSGFAAAERRIVVSASRTSQTVAVALLPNSPPTRLSPARSEAMPKPVAPRAVRTAVPGAPATTRVSVGSLSVESRPAGASVFVDDRPVGTTPLSIAEMSQGQHTVRIELAGYRRWSSSTMVTSGEASRVTASLEK
jgi:hypothetical protein